MIHSTTPKRDKARDHLSRMNTAIDEVLSTMESTPWLRGNEDRLRVLHERRDAAIRYMKRFRRSND